MESILAKTNYRSKLEENFKFDLIKKTENVTNGWLENLENEISAIKQKHNQERTGKEVNDDLSAIASTLSYLGSSKYFLKSYLLPDYWEIVERYCKYAESDILNECNKLLEEIKFKELPTPIMPSEENLPQLLNEKFSNTRLNEKKSFLYMGFNSWVDKKYNGSEIQIHITSVASEWKRQIQNRKELWVNNLFNMHFTSYCENRRSSFSSHVRRLFDDFEAYNKQNNEAADATERIIIIMNEGLRKLEQPIDNAFVSLK